MDESATKSTFEIIAGSYEEYLVGYIFSNHGELRQSFAAHDHSSSVRCIATSDNYLASGGADDRIIVYDLKTRREHCMLTHHEATITCLQFTQNHSHIVSGSSDGLLAIVRIGNWQVEKVWPQAHKGSSILDIAIHSSGKLALTLGSDCSLRTWNLVKGRQAYVVNLNSKSKDPRRLEKILWNPNDEQFLLYGGNYTEIWSIETGGVLDIVQHDEKVNSCVWLDENRFLAGYENGQMALVYTENDEFKKDLIAAHDSRIRAMVKHDQWVVTASSGGEIKVWDTKNRVKEVASCNTGCRLTCLCIANVVKKEKEQVESAPQEQVVKTVEKKKVCRVTIEIEGSDEEEPPKTKKKKSVDKTVSKKSKKKKVK